MQPQADAKPTFGQLCQRFLVVQAVGGGQHELIADQCSSAGVVPETAASVEDSGMPWPLTGDRGPSVSDQWLVLDLADSTSLGWGDAGGWLNRRD